MIQEDSIVEKLFNMHFPSEGTSMETQTQVTWISDMRTLGERVERIEDIVEVTESKPDVALLESGNSTMTIREDEVLKVKERLEASDQEERGRQQRCEEKAAPPSGETSETFALTSGKLKLKIKTE